MNAQQLWAAYREKSGVAHDNYTAWAFGGDPDGLAELVLAGKKRATCSLGRVYELTGEPIPALGEYSVILNSRQEAVCIIRTTCLRLIPFCQVDAALAAREGEGDLSLAYWQRVHRDFFEKELAPYGERFDEGMELIFEEFELVYER